MKKADRVKEILKLLDEFYGEEDKCYLNHSSPYELLIATMLSAQCTDDRVNIVTKDLFQKYKTIEDFAFADQLELQKDIHSTGFYRNKSKNIISAMSSILNLYGGIVPSSIEELTSLSGVGRKTANVVRTHIYKIPSIVVDTHVKRISYKLGIVKSTDPVKIEFELMKILPKGHWGRYNTQIIAHGRTICKARNPACNTCLMQECCKSFPS